MTHIAMEHVVGHERKTRSAETENTQLVHTNTCYIHMDKHDREKVMG